MKKRSLWPEVGSLSVFVLSLFTLFSLISFHPEDPSFLTRGYGSTANWCGPLGAHLAAALLNGLGLGAFLVPAAFFFVAASLFRVQEWGESLSRSFGVLAGMSVAVIALTVFVSLSWRSWTYSGVSLLTGGALGVWVAQHLEAQTGRLGGSLISALVFSVAVVSSTPLRLAQWGGRIIARLGRLLPVLGAALMRLTRILGGYALYGLGVGSLKLSRVVGAQARRLGERIAVVGGQAMQLALPQGAIQKNSERDGATEANAAAVMITDASESTPAAEEMQLESEAALMTNPPSWPSVVSPRQLPLGVEEIPILPHEKSAPAGAMAAAAPKPVRPKRSGAWKLPAMEFLKKVPKIESSIDKAKLQSSAQILVQKFRDFGIDGEVTAVRPGPVITLFEFKPGPGVKVSRIAALADDLSMALSAQSVRILAPLPGKAVVGIEIPSDHREIVYLREFLQGDDFYGSRHAIPVVMGKDIGGQPILSDLAKMPHLLCAGQTGSGKSVFMNGLICSLFYRFTPDELRMILVDPKFIEFRSYQDMPHLLLPVVDDPKQAATALKWAVQEMERRYRILAKLGARNLASFNQKVEEMGADVVRDLLVSEDESESTPGREWSGADWMEAFEPDEQGVPKVGKLPFIVVIIDELADLMMVAKKEVEVSIARIAQKARAAGIHLIIATQRPSTDVITGLIKANLPSRVSFQLASFVDSKTILDRAGAERLLGQGDMLFIPPGSSQPVRLHGAYLDDDEINKVTAFLKAQGKPVYRDEILLVEDEEDSDLEDSESDERFDEAVELVKRTGHASASFLQRHLKVGYNRAARMIENMETRGIVGPAEGARPREVLIR